MATDIKFTLATVSNGTFVPVATGSYSLRVSPFSTAAYTATPDSNGILDFDAVADGSYRLYNETTGLQVASFGERIIMDAAPTFTSVAVTPSTGTVTTDTIAEASSGAGVTIDGVLLKDNDIKADEWTEKTSSGGCNVANELKVNGGATFTLNTSGSGATKRPVMSYSDGYVAPANDAELAEKKYVDDKVATIVATPFQESINKVRVMAGGTAEAGKVYLTIASAIAYFASPAATNQCLVEIAGTGATSQYITISHTNLVNYVHLRGLGRHIKLIMGVSGASTTNNVNVENCEVFFGANDIATARTYNSFMFKDCAIYSYQNLTFTNCKLQNVIIYQASGKTITLSGTTEWIGGGAMQAVTKGSCVFTGQDNLNNSFTMPTDPSASS